METVIACQEIRMSDGSVIDQGRIVIEGSRIKSMESGGQPTGKGYRLYSFPSGTMLPGLIDSHVHGYGSTGWQTPLNLSLALAQRGITSFLVTIPAEGISRSNIEQISRSMGQEKGARILGLNLEGPFLNPHMAGAQNRESIKEPDIDFARNLLQAGNGQTRIMTLAPELPGARDLMQYLKSSKVLVAAGHSQASFAELQELASFIDHITHLFNRCGTWHHREPSLTGWGLVSDSVSVELIGEPDHLHPGTLDIAIRCKPPGKAILISDAVPLDFTSPSVLTGSAMYDHQGTLQGTVWSLTDSLLWASRHLEGGLQQLLPLVTENPARALGLEDKGNLQPGRDADLVILVNEHPVMTVREGEVVFWDPSGEN